MSHGKLSSAQARIVAAFVKDELVHDLGAGDLELARQLIALGARGVVAVDKNPTHKRVPLVRQVASHFHAFEEPIEVAFVSWPVNWQDLGVVGLVKRAPLVIYLGTNMDGIACGTGELYWDLSKREVLAHEPHPKNTLIVYGHRSVTRDPLPEEIAGMDPTRLYRYREMYPAMARITKVPPAAAMGVMIWNQCMTTKTSHGGQVRQLGSTSVWGVSAAQQKAAEKRALGRAYRSRLKGR